MNVQALPWQVDEADSAVNAISGPGRSGAQLLATALCDAGVEIIFGYPGGANLELFDALQATGLRCVRTEHEQGAAHAAEGYARATGNVGVCVATSGPGATNLVTGIADANSDSVPILAITGNVATALLGRNAFQEVDIVSIVRPITKQAWQVKSPETIPDLVFEALRLAAGPRPGPVLIDIPKDMQQQRVSPAQSEQKQEPAKAIEIPAPSAAGPMSAAELDECIELLTHSSRPVIYAGGGVLACDSGRLLVELSERLNAPVTTTMMGLGAISPKHPLCFGVLGMHGAHFANVAVNEADVVLAVGVRFDDRVTGDVDAFIRNGKIIHIDVDRQELNKNKVVALPVHADLRDALAQLCERARRCNCDDWLAYLERQKNRYPLDYAPADDLTGVRTIKLLSELTEGNALITTGVGQHQMWAMQHYAVAQSRSFVSSSGFGTMGFGLPAAIGAKLGCPDRLVIDIDGDGSLNMSIHELAACRRLAVGVKVLVINNQWLGMVRQWQDMIYDGRRVESDLSDASTEKGDSAVEAFYPDFVQIARGYRIRAERVTHGQQLHSALQRLVEDPDEPYLLDVMVEREQNVYPMIPAGKSYRDVMHSDADLPAVGVGDT